MNVTRAATSAQVLLPSVSASFPLSFPRLLVRYGRTTAIQRSRRRSYNAASSYDLYDHRPGTCSLEEFRFHSRDERRRKSHSAPTGTGLRGTSTLRGTFTKKSYGHAESKTFWIVKCSWLSTTRWKGSHKQFRQVLASIQQWGSPITGRWRRW